MAGANTPSLLSLVDFPDRRQFLNGLPGTDNTRGEAIAKFVLYDEATGNELLVFDQMFVDRLNYDTGERVQHLQSFVRSTDMLAFGTQRQLVGLAFSALNGQDTGGSLADPQRRVPNQAHLLDMLHARYFRISQLARYRRVLVMFWHGLVWQVAWVSLSVSDNSAVDHVLAGNLQLEIFADLTARYEQYLGTVVAGDGTRTTPAQQVADAAAAAQTQLRAAGKPFGSNTAILARDRELSKLPAVTGQVSRQTMSWLLGAQE